MERFLKNTSVRAGLLAILVTFALMIVVGAAVGVLALSTANVSTERVHAISARSMLLNDAYKDMMRARTGLARVYGMLRENPGTPLASNALDSAESGVKKSLAQLDAFKSAPAIEGVDQALRQAAAQAAQAHADAVQRAMAALRASDAAAYATINAKDVTSSGAAWSVEIERFQKLSSQLAQEEADGGQARYGLIVKFVSVGIVMALALIAAVHYALKAFVVTPLNDAVDVLTRVAEGDLSVQVRKADATSWAGCCRPWPACAPACCRRCARCAAARTRSTPARTRSPAATSICRRGPSSSRRRWRRRPPAWSR